ncbi:MAG: cell division protein FtsA [Mariniphaga sp.]
MGTKTNFSVVVDIGTSKMAAFAGRKNEDNKIEILGMAKVPSRGIKRGMVLNIDEAAASVTLLMGELEKQMEEKITAVSLTYAAQPMRMMEYKAGRLTTGEGMVTQSDVDELYKEAQNIQVEAGFRILHIIPQSYIIDGEITDLSPAGITGRKIEAVFKIISVPEVYLTNFHRVMEKAGLTVDEIVLSPIAMGEAALTYEEKEMGAILLDIGAGTTKLAVYHEGAMIHTAVIPFGGDVVTRDIKEGCSILLKWAEQLKVQYGHALGDFADERKVVTIPGHNGWEPKEISFKSLAFIIQARMEEIVDSVYFQIEQTGVADQLGLGIVLTGGTSELNNLVSLVKFRTGMDTRLAHPVFKPVNLDKSFERTNYLTALGLLHMALENAEPASKKAVKKIKKKKENRFSPWFKNVVQGVLDYVDDDEDVAFN